MNLDRNGANLRSEVPGRGCATNGLVHEPPLLRPTIRIASAPVVRRQQDTASPSFSTDESKAGAVRTHVVMLTPMHRPYDSTPLTVTFDTNTLASVVAPETAQRGTGASGAIVAAAMRAGRVRGFFSETVITLEGIKNVDRADVLGSARVVSDASSTGKNNVTLTVGIRHVRNPLDPRSSARVRAALELGMRSLRTAARIGGYHLRDQDCELYEPDGGILELVRCMDKVNELTTEIARRGVGQAIAVELGLQFSQRDGVENPELFLQGLGRAKDKPERRKVAEAVREWADGDSVAAHYGFGLKLFCSEDFRKDGTGRSVLDHDNRQWLNTKFGIEFVTLAELAQRVIE
ncbi:MAG: hypothetical protein WDM86_21800 [Rhizomicrobium sp.]